MEDITTTNKVVEVYDAQTNELIAEATDIIMNTIRECACRLANRYEAMLMQAVEEKIKERREIKQIVEDAGINQLQQKIEKL